MDGGRSHPAGLTEGEYLQLLKHDRKTRAWDWRVRIQNPEVYAKGRVSHLDHATIRLACWHRVYMNTENKAVARKFVVFLD